MLKETIFLPRNTIRDHPKHKQKQNGPRNSELTEREIEVLFNICKGLSNSAIADELNISKRTIDKHRENILIKTHSSNTAQMVVYAIKNKIFEI